MDKRPLKESVTECYVDEKGRLCESVVMDAGDQKWQKWQEWRRDGKLHRDGDLPAIVWANGCRAWFRDGVPGRDDDNQPAVVMANGGKLWYRDGKPYRTEEAK